MIKLPLANSVLTGLELLIYQFGVKEKERQVDASLEFISYPSLTHKQ